MKYSKVYNFMIRFLYSISSGFQLNLDNDWNQQMKIMLHPKIANIGVCWDKI